MRTAILTVGLVFTAFLGVLTVQDLGRYGPTPAGVAGALIVALLGIALVGALLHPPEQ